MQPLQVVVILVDGLKYMVGGVRYLHEDNLAVSTFEAASHSRDDQQSY